MPLIAAGRAALWQGRAGAVGQVVLPCLAVAVAMIALASCGSSSSSSKSPELTGFGAAESAWNAHHDKSSSTTAGCTGVFSCYGAYVETPAGARPQFTHVSSSHDRIIGLTYNMPVNTAEATAMEKVKALLPADAKVTTTGTLGSPPDTCLAWNLRSAKMAEALPSSIGNKEGNVGVIFSTLGPTGDFTSYDANNVNEASLTIIEHKLTGLC